ncbi:MAG: MarR family transcriptional regulator [Butyrivibrio sp.]|nr:MarR family transcriptional regulator [Butyrivibrio sp.]
MISNSGFLISQIKSIGSRVFERLLSLEGVNEFNGAQGKILYVLWQKDRISIAELSESVGLAKTTMTSMLDRMEAAELIVRTHNPKDRREILISLTPKAQVLHAKYEEVSAKMTDVYFKGFKEKEIEMTEKLLMRILQNVKEEL